MHLNLIDMLWSDLKPILIEAAFGLHLVVFTNFYSNLHVPLVCF